MKQRIGELLSTSFKGMIELVFFSFLWLPLAFYSLSWTSTICWLLLLLASYSCFTVLLSNKKTNNIYVALLAIINTVIISTILFFQLKTDGHILLYVAIIAFTLIFTISGYRQYAMQFKNSFTMPTMGILFLFHILLQLLKGVWLVDLIEINALLYAFGVASVILLMFINNERTLAEQQKLIGHSTAHKHALQMNRILISIFSAIIISILLFRSWQEKIEAWIRQLINWFIRQGEGEPIEQVAEVEEGLPQFPFGEENESHSSLFLLIEKLIMIIAYIAFGILLIIVTILIVKFIAKVFNQILAFLNKDANKLEDDEMLFIDEIEEIDTAAKKERRKFKLFSSSKVNWKAMSLNEKCQYLYVLFIRHAEQKGHHYINHLTANEQVNLVMENFELNVSESEARLLIQIYNEARYRQSSDAIKDISSAQLDHLFKKFTEKK